MPNTKWEELDKLLRYLWQVSPHNLEDRLPAIKEQIIEIISESQKEEIRKEIEKRKAPKGQLFLQEKNVYRNKIIDDILNLKCLN